MAKSKLGPWAELGGHLGVRLGTDTLANAGTYTDTETGKFVKFVGDSRYALCAAGDPIEGLMASLEPGTSDGYSIGSIMLRGRVECVCDGLEATPGTGTIAVGDYVCCGTIVAKGTALTTAPKVCKMTNQPGAVIVSTVGAADTAAAIKVQIDASLVNVADAERNALFPWRVLSIGSAGAVGDTCVIAKF